MHISLDQAIGRQPRLNRVGQSLLNIASGASAAYSLRSLTGDEPKAVRIRRDGDNEERDFTTAEIVNEAADWTNGKQETTLPADVATSSAAYSLRKVRSTYSGPAVRIRRTSDDIDADVAFDTNDTLSNDSIVTEVLSGNQSTLQAFISGTNAAVATWYDQSGNSKNATQATDAEQPLIASGGSLLTAGITFDGTDDRLDIDGYDPLSLAYSSFVVASIEAPYASGLRTIFDSSDSTNGGFSIAYGNTSNKFTPFWFDGDDTAVNVFGAGSNLTNAESLYSTIIKNGDSTVHLDGTLDQTRTISWTSAGSNSLSKSTIGYDQTTANRQFTGKIQEIIIYESDQTNNRFKIDSNINNHYGLYTAAQNGFVNTWYDQSGNSRNATAAADANEPKIVENGSYLGELSFDGSNHTLSIATVSTLGIDGSNNKSAFAVARTTAGTDGFVIAGVIGGSSFRGLRYRSNTTNGLARLEVSGFGVEGGDLSDGNNHVYSSIFDGTQTKDFDVSLDGSITQGSGTDVINTDGTITFSVGTAAPNADAGFTREFILYASDQTANRTAIETNIANEYGINLS